MILSTGSLPTNRSWVAAGQNLIPWPNRIRDGRYTFEGSTQQLALSEPARHNASHGLGRYVAWTLVDRSADAVTNRVRIYPQTGWPGTLEALVTHQVGESGLVVTVHATNIGAGNLPYGYAAHPYLTVGEELVDEIALTVPAESYLEVDDRLLPIALAPVDGTPNDLRSGPVLGPANLDVAMTGLARDADGRWRVRLTLGERQTELWGDESMPLGAGLHRRAPPELVGGRRADDLWTRRVQRGPDPRGSDRPPARGDCSLPVGHHGS